VKFLVVAVGHRMPDWVTAGFEEYRRRMPREALLGLVEIRPEPRPDAGVATVRRAVEAEGRRITAVLPPRCTRVALDERGTPWNSAALARRVAQWQMDGGDVAFVIGGADGLSPQLRQEADLQWSLSALTLPHGLVRVVLAEQLYRAVSILRNHPYHRA